ncbi:hypothetical protein SAMN02745229_01122 [Butyrivibrio fibrisolvens DSM 3071]|uniref:Uncharacterized protein n=1 Tax=Butyrivibrio fibrisolvens DSM 3071 TaxID=1121131 RepID=A0A1M5WQH1_BUTFI|nr:hypothetical protein [Butyrivibrio fibrisolvens]SHH89846.1 hypothetical protein SAMN02745229_01122 [Butyrivibrio fibrisolvens DSM 3071]
MDFDLFMLYLILFGIPAGVFIWFIVSIIYFIKRDKEDKRSCRMRIISLCLSGSFLLALIMFYLFVSWLLTQMIANM